MKAGAKLESATTDAVRPQAELLKPYLVLRHAHSTIAAKSRLDPRRLVTHPRRTSLQHFAKAISRDKTVIKTALVAMTIVGCDCDARLCEYIGETPAKWSTIADCEAAMKSQMLHERNFNYPLVSGICRTTQMPSSQLAATASQPELTTATRAATDPLPEELSDRPSIAVGSQATATETEAATPAAYESVVDGGRSVLYRTNNGYALVKTDLGRAASATIGMAKRSATWLAAKMPAGL
jgi:hypothetical protein